YAGSLLVLSPWRPFVTVPDDPRIIHTVGRLEDLEALADQGRSTGQRPRILLERMTTMLRHGFSARGLRDAGRLVADSGGVAVAAMHLPLAKTSHLTEVERLMNDVVAAGIDRFDAAHPGSRTIWVSHLTEAELSGLAAEYPDFTFRPRVGTSLWLGDRGALS